MPSRCTLTTFALAAAAAAAQGAAGRTLAVTEEASLGLLPDGELVAVGRKGAFASTTEFDPLESIGDAVADLGDKLPRLDLGMEVDLVAAGSFSSFCVGSKTAPASQAVKCFGDCTTDFCAASDTTSGGKDLALAKPAAPFVALEGNATVLDVQAGEHHACVLFSDGGVACWTSSRLGIKMVGHDQGAGIDKPPPLLPLGAPAKQIAVGPKHSCALLQESGEVVCWGKGLLGYGANEDGRLAGPETIALGRPAKAIAVGQDHTCAVLADDGAVKCWGRNHKGQLGYGDMQDRGAPADSAVDLDGGAALVALGGHATCVGMESGKLKCWGWNLFGKLGLGSSTSMFGVNPNEVPRLLPAVDFGQGELLELELSVGHACVRVKISGDDVAIRCWGANGFGELGRGESTLIWGTEAEHMGDGLKDWVLNGAVTVAPTAASTGHALDAAAGLAVAAALVMSTCK